MTQEFVVHPRGPFDLENQNRYFGSWPVVDGAVAMAFPVEGWRSSAAVLLRQDSARVVGEVHGARGDDAAKAWRQALAALSLDFDGEPYVEVGRRDRPIGRLQEQYAYLRPTLFHSPYEGACGFTIGHRLSIMQARKTRANIAAEFGAQVDAGGQRLAAFPAPQQLLALDVLPGVAAPKVERLHAIARAALEGWLDRDWLRAQAQEVALAKLETLPGIGPFFSQGILYRAAGLPDAMPDDDLTARAVRSACKLPESAGWTEVEARAEAWRPYRMWCTVLLHVWYRSQPGSMAGLRGGASERGRASLTRRQKSRSTLSRLE